ncbi:MAG TPA: DHA2 family efflux MFS transporter permease subunit [Candidatus Angelobacter sp.]|nr:DHA2 family efflux MFS transporter permease subunit [Candidatus Angelobacter sp.]
MPDKEPAHHGNSPAKPKNGALEAGVPPDKWTRWMIAIAVMVSAVMELVDTSAVNVSLPYIAGNLSASVDEATWVLTSYLVANAIILPLSGWLANYFGRKRLLMMSVTGFTIASILCGFAPSLPALVLFRVLQGAAGGVLQPTTRAIMLEAFPREERGHAMAFWGVGIVIAPIVAPMLGGWLTTDYSWRWIFFINLPISLLGLFLVWTYVFDPPYIRRTSTRIDYWGMGFLAIGIAALQIVFDKGQEEDWFASHFIVTMAIIAIIGLVTFVIWEMRASNAVVHFRLFRYRTFAAGTSLSLVLFFALYGSIVLLPLFMQELLDFPAVTAGIWNSPRGIATLAMMPIAGILIGRRWDMRALLSGGLFISGIGAYMFSYLNLNVSPWSFFWPQIVMGAGLSFMFVPLATITVDPIPQEEMGYATSLIGLARNLGAGIGISVFTAFIARRQQFHQVRLVVAASREQSPLQGMISGLQSFLGHQGGNSGPMSHQALAMIYRRILQSAAALSYLDGFRIMAALLFLTIPFVWIMKKPQFKSGGEGTH